MIIREYEYEKERPWNCQERFIEMVNCDDPCDDLWQEYKDKLLGVSPSEISMGDRIIKDTMREGNKGDNALSFEFEIRGVRFVHVSQDRKCYSGDLIVKRIRNERRINND